MSEPKKSPPHKRTTGKRRPPGKGPRRATSGKRSPKGAPPNGRAKGKKGAKQAVAKKRPNTPAYRFGTAIILSVIGFGLAAIGLAGVNQGLAVSITEGRDAVAQPALQLTGGLLGAFTGLLLAWLLAGRMRWLMGSITALVLTGGFAFAGQTLLPGIVDQRVAQSQPAQKQAALRSAFVHQSAAAGALQVEGLPTDLTLADTRSFIAGLGALASLDPSVYDRMDSNVDRLADAILARGLTEEAAWRRFQEAVAQTERDFERYRRAADEVIETRDNVDQAGARLWEAVTQSAEARWTNYAQRRSNAINRLSAQIPDFRDLLSVYFRVRQRGGDMGEMEQRYGDFSNDLFGQYVDPQEWCGLSGCPGTLDYLNEAGKEVLSRTFMQRSNGLSLDLDEQAFYEHPSIREQLREEIAVSGVELPADWAVNARGRIALFEAARRDLPVAAEIRYNTMIEEWFSTTLSPDLGYADFIAQEGIQQLLRQSLDLPVEIRIDPTIDRATFVADYYPRIERSPVDALAGDMQAPLDDFAEAARLTAASEVAMTTGLALPLVLFAGGLAGLSGLIMATALLAIALIRIVARLLRMGEPQMKKINRLTGLATTGALALVLGLPLVLSTGVTGYPGYRAALSPAVSAQPLIGMPSAWAMSMSSSLQDTGRFAQANLLGNRSFGLDPVIDTEQGGFGFVFEYDDRDPTVIEEPDTGPVGITGIRNALDNLIDRQLPDQVEVEPR